jgi:hypothetical protein
MEEHSEIIISQEVQEVIQQKLMVVRPEELYHLLMVPVHMVVVVVVGAVGMEGTKEVLEHLVILVFVSFIFMYNIKKSY